MKTNVIKTKHGNRQYKMCQCCVCNKVSRCTPTNDFYETKEHGDGIVCEKCFSIYLKEFHGIKGIIK